MTGRAIITFENVTKRYGKVVAVDNVSLSIDEGEFFALLGPNGAPPAAARPRFCAWWRGWRPRTRGAS